MALRIAALWWLLGLLGACGTDRDDGAPPPEDAPEAVTGEPAAAESAAPAQPGVASMARADLAARLQIEPEEVEILEARRVYWSSAALGCPQPDRAYAQVMTEGWFIRLAVGAAEYRYHSSVGGPPFTCHPARAEPPHNYETE